MSRLIDVLAIGVVSYQCHNPIEWRMGRALTAPQAIGNGIGIFPPFAPHFVLQPRSR